LVGWHDPPWAHALQTPLSQTSPVPHELPFGRTVPVSVHEETLPVQSSEPTWQTFVGVHGAPAVHARQVPLSQALPVPHGAPLAAGLPVSLQTAWPEAQSSVPVWHTSTGVHAAPASQRVPVSEDTAVSRRASGTSPAMAPSDASPFPAPSPAIVASGAAS
jgi:hypothetical protein